MMKSKTVARDNTKKYVLLEKLTADNLEQIAIAAGFDSSAVMLKERHLTAKCLRGRYGYAYAAPPEPATIPCDTVRKSTVELFLFGYNDYWFGRVPVLVCDGNKYMFANVW